MASKKINELNELTSINYNDLIPVYDVSDTGSEKTKKATLTNFMKPISEIVNFNGLDMGGNDFDSSVLIFDSLPTGGTTITNWAPTVGKIIYLTSPGASVSKPVTITTSGLTFDGNSDQLIFNDYSQALIIYVYSSSRAYILSNTNNVDYTSGGA